jgi:TolB protein
VPLSRIELLVNGEVAQTLPVPSQLPARQELQGRLTLPKGGWVAARAVGSKTQWPAMDSYPYAHTSPIWLGTRGSTDPDKRRLAAQLLLRALGHSEARLREAFPLPSPPGAQPDPVPRLRQRLMAARARLLELSR